METNELSELAFLADYVQKPDETSRYAEGYLITDETFATAKCAALWRLLTAAETRDHVALLKIARDALELKTDKPLDEFLDRADTMNSKIIERARQLAHTAYRRNVNTAIAQAQSFAAQHMVDSAAFIAMVNEAANSVPKVPEPNWDSERESAAIARDNEEEIPDQLLHIPGFIDELVGYTMACAHSPHRTLAFSGALALLSHLMGRKFTDRRGTRPNLYLIALGPTAIGKDIARKINRKIAAKVDMSHTIADQVASGEAIEDFLSYSPSALIQLDEIHKTLAQLKDNTDKTALGISKFLLQFYSTAGSVHTMRLKASGQMKIDPRSRVIYDPSLTLYGTGVPHIFYRSLTLDALEDGLVGRCLAFEAMREGEPNEFSGPQPVIPSLVMSIAEEFSARNRLLGVDRDTEPDVIAYTSDAEKRLGEIQKEARSLRAKCQKESDYAGYALWGRASEKAAKIAMIYAVSENFVSPQVTLEAIDFSWRLVKFLTERMCARAARWIGGGKLDEQCARVIDFVERTKNHTTTRREVARKLKLNHDEIVKIEATLADRGEIEIIPAGKSSIVYRLCTEAKSEEKGEF